MNSPYPQARFALDQSGITKFLVDQQNALVKYPTACKSSVTLLGDSTMAYGDNIQSGGTGVGETSQSHVAWCSAFMRGVPFRVVANRAVGGTLIDSGANSLMTQLVTALTDQCDILWVRSGVNHLNPAIDATLPTVQTIVNKFKRFLDIAASAKACVIIDSINPLNGNLATPSGAYPRHTDIPVLNSMLKDLCDHYMNVIYNDTYRALAQDNFGNADPSLVSALDGIHQQTSGAFAMGLVSASNLLPQLALANSYRVVKTVALPDFTGTNGGSAPGSGTVTGQISANMNVVNAAGTANVACTTQNNSMTLNIDNSQSAVVGTIQVKLVSQTAALGTFANGDLLTAYGRLNVQGAAGLNRANLIFQLNPAGTVANVDSLSKSVQETSNPVTKFPNVNYEGNFNTRPWALNAAPTSINITLTLEVQPGKKVVATCSGWGLNAVLPI